MGAEIEALDFDSAQSSPATLRDMEFSNFSSLSQCLIILESRMEAWANLGSILLSHLGGNVSR